jgi:hypothetical protein
MTVTVREPALHQARLREDVRPLLGYGIERIM